MSRLLCPDHFDIPDKDTYVFYITPLMTRYKCINGNKTTNVIVKQN